MVDYNIVLMSGRGQRFKDKGYSIPKPFIPINNKTLIENVIESFPSCKKWIFTINKEINDSLIFQEFYKDFSRPKEVFVLEDITNGQATSCLETLDLVENDKKFFVGSCDAIFENKLNFQNEENFDGQIVTSPPTELQKQSSADYGLVVGNSNIIKVTCKEPIVEFQEAYVITGSFYFKSKEIYKELYEEMLRKNLYVNDELYIDTIFQLMHSSGYKTSNYPINTLVVGTPEEYEIYIDKK